MVDNRHQQTSLIKPHNNYSIGIYLNTLSLPTIFSGTPNGEVHGEPVEN
jgi:hypothetical protein